MIVIWEISLQPDQEQSISGNCTFGEKIFGTNSSVRQGVSICNDVTIGMGGVVVKNISRMLDFYRKSQLKNLKRNKKTF